MICLTESLFNMLTCAHLISCSSLTFTALSLTLKTSVVSALVLSLTLTTSVVSALSVTLTTSVVSALFVMQAFSY